MLLSPIIVSASGTYETADNGTICYEGLVPCGKAVYQDGTLEDGKCVGGTEITVPCQLCHFLIMFVGIIDFFLLPPGGLIWIIGIVMFVLAGAMYIFGMVVSPGNPSTVQSANRIITSTIMGLALALAAYIFVNTLFVFIGAKEWTGLREGWFQIDCPVYVDPYAET